MSEPLDYPVVELSDAEVARERTIFEPLTRSVRALNLATLRTTVRADEVAAIRAEIDALTRRLEAQAIPGSFGVAMTPTGKVRAYGNAVVGMRNPNAVPLIITHTPEGRAESEFELSALHEGPPGMVHGGVLALVLDQLLGEAAAAAGTPGMTGTLSLRYLRPTRLGSCRGAAWVETTEGIKTIVRGEVQDSQDRVTVEATGIFILPRWARGTTDDQPPRIRFE